jgi:2',3'-cyclic-nucleotide 2'-phosphodiesterase/3'-nucleotidase
MSKVASYISDNKNHNTIVLDNGDNLQGNPAVYYYNFEDTSSPHIWAEVLNYLSYDAVTVGNHDLEGGHDVYDRIRKEYNFPMLAANAISIVSGEPYFKPFEIIESGGLKVAVIGLITPGVPGWLPEILYSGIEFEDMVESAAKWMPVVQLEQPDIIIGLFHAGWDEEYGPGVAGSYKNENASLSVAREVPGFDIVFIGHDHDVKLDYVINKEQDSVLVLDGGSHARYISVADISISGVGESRKTKISGQTIRTDTLSPDKSYTDHFSPQFEEVQSYVKREIGTIAESISTRDSYFGDSPFMDLIHTVQLETSGADISFAAPLSYDITIEKGAILVKDMFDLYRFENMLYTIMLSGSEIDLYLEYSYSLWIESMKHHSDPLLKLEYSEDYPRFKNRYYNFDSAAGINYTVDVTKEDGDRISITGMSDGNAFSNDSLYSVALNSYRGSGGGGHLIRGCGLDDTEIASRLVKATEKDLRFYMIKWFENNREVGILQDNNWKFIPESIVDKAKEREYKLLFIEEL